MGMPDEGDKPELYVLMRASCPSHVPVPCDAVVYKEYPPGAGIEVSWHIASVHTMADGSSGLGVAQGDRNVGGLSQDSSR